MNKVSSENRLPSKVMVIGLDGATFDLINQWVNQGFLPTFEKILREGAHGPLTTVIPPLTGPAWISFMTGKNPGKHGIYDFVIRSTNDYYGTPINASHSNGESIWSLLSKAGKRVGVFMVPATYPPEPVNGFMVTGMLTPADALDFVYPKEIAEDYLDAVPEMGSVSEGLLHPLGREQVLLEGMDRLTQIMMKSTDYFFDHYDLDFYMLVFKEPDLAMHWLWRFMDADHPWFTPADGDLQLGIQRVYERMDACLQNLLDKVDDDTLVIIMSDHGAGKLEKYFHVNSWLIDKGYMQLKNDPLTQLKRLLYALGITPISLYGWLMKLRQGQQVAKTMRHRKKRAISMLRRMFLSFDNVDWRKTKAYSLGNYGQIYINLKGRELEGIVESGDEYEQIVDQIREDLSMLKDPQTGEHIQGKVYRADEIYHGERLDQAPDLVFLPDDLSVNGFGLYQFSSRNWLTPTFDRSGGHRMDGIFMMTGPGTRKGGMVEDANIIDLAPTILAALGIPIPNDFDGNVLISAFENTFFENRPIKHIEAEEYSKIDGRGELTDEEEEQIREMLRGLGYMA